MLLVSEGTQGHLPPKGTHRWVCQAATYIPVTGQQAEWNWREEAAQGGSGDCQEAGAGRPGVPEDGLPPPILCRGKMHHTASRGRLGDGMFHT